MKFSIIILFVLGLIAAACAAILMGIVNLNPTASGNPQILVAMATVPLPAMSVVTQENIAVENVSRDELPRGGILVNPKSVVGRVLSLPVVEGQILTESCFVPMGSSSQLLAQIPHGMRAFAVQVSSRAMPDRALLSPGCVVDVLVSYKLSSRDTTEGEALSTTMLRGVQVLAISGESVMSNTEDGEEKANKESSPRRGGNALVTLLVDTRQAEALQLAIENGNITLSIRNPLDKDEFDEDPSILNKGKLTPRGADLPPAVLPSGNNRELQIPSEGPKPGQEATSDSSQQGSTGNSDNGTTTAAPRPKSGNKYDEGRNPLREITVIRGNKKEVEEFDDAGAVTEKTGKK